MRITVVYNARPTGFDRSDPELEKHIEGDEWKTIEAVGQAIESHGHSVNYVPVDDNIYQNLYNIKEKTDLLFNLAEGLSGTADREAQVPMLAEMLRIPYTGPTPLSAALILNKHRTKQIWTSTGLPTAASQLFTNTQTPLAKELRYPLLVKPNSDGSGIGIHETSIVKNEKELQSAVKHILNHYHQEALVESYLPGREFTVAIVGNGENRTVLPIIEINFAAFPGGAPAIDSYEAKFVYGATGEAEMHETEFCPAMIPKKLEKEIVELCQKAYQVIGCRDFGRLDVRLDENDRPHLLEINYPPGLMSDPEESSFMTISARAHGWDFSALIGNILKAATKRLSERSEPKNYLDT
jgi:D-alanine-D-alanine ligase